MVPRYAVLSEVLSDSSVVYNVFDMTNVSMGPVYEATDLLDGAMRSAVFNIEYERDGIVRGEPCEANNFNKEL